LLDNLLQEIGLKHGDVTQLSHLVQEQITPTAAMDAAKPTEA